MNRAHLRKLLLRAFLGAGIALASPALAQYRPPPMSEAERLIAKGDEARAEAGKAQLSGDKNLAKDRFRKAAELYREALSQAPDALAAAAGFGEAAGAIGEYAQVVELLAPVAAAHPEALEVVWPLGVAYLKLKRYPEAIPLLEKVAGARLSDAERARYYLAPYYLGRYYLYERRAEPAVKSLNQYLRDRPAALAASDYEVQLMLGEAYLLLRQPAAARAAFLAAKSGRAESLGTEMGLVAVLEQEGKLKEAADQLAGLVKRFPDRPEPRERAGWILLALGEHAKAEEAARSALQLKPSGTGHQLLGEILLAQGKLPEAEAALRQAVMLQPNLDAARVTLAHAIQRQGRNAEAAKVLEDAAAGGVDSPELYAALGSVYRRAGRFQDALEAHARVVQKAPRQAWGHVLLGADHLASGQWQAAVEDYERALQLEPNHAGAKKWLARALAHRAQDAVRAGRLEEAARDLRRALDLEPTATVARSLGATLLALKAYAEAEAVMERASRLPGAGWKDGLLHGYALLGGGKAAQAQTAFERAAGLTRDAEPLSQIYAGWALAKLEQGEFDTAVEKLSEAGGSGSAAQVTRENLPVALVRRALMKIKNGEASAAGKDLDAAARLFGGRGGEVAKLAQLARALVEAESDNPKGARIALSKAVGGRSPAGWERRNTAELVGAYLAYRQGQVEMSRKLLATGRSRADAAQAEWIAQLGRALDRREGELAWRAGEVAKAGKALRAAAKSDPLNPFVLNNLACVDWRTGHPGAAVAAWERVAEAIPEAHLNLGIDAQTRQRDMSRAVEHYARYLASGGPRAAQVREWKERLQSIYGIAEPRLEKSASKEEP